MSIPHYSTWKRSYSWSDDELEEECRKRGWTVREWWVEAVLYNVYSKRPDKRFNLGDPYVPFHPRHKVDWLELRKLSEPEARLLLETEYAIAQVKGD